MADNTPKTLTTFHCFGKLPLEMRRVIWNLNNPSRIIDIFLDVRRDGARAVCLSPISVNLAVCKESRTEYLEQVEMKKLECPDVKNNGGFYISDDRRPTRLNPFWGPLGYPFPMNYPGLSALKISSKIKVGLYIDPSTDVICITEASSNTNKFAWASMPACFKARTLAFEGHSMRSWGDITWVLYTLKLHGAQFQEVLFVGNQRFPSDRSSYLLPGSELEHPTKEWTRVAGCLPQYVNKNLLAKWFAFEKDRKGSGQYPMLPPSLNLAIDPVYRTGTFKAMKPPIVGVMHSVPRTI